MCVISIVLYYVFKIKVQYSALSLFICCNCMIVCSETSVCLCKFTHSSKTLRYFSRRPTPLCSISRLLRPLLLNFNLLEVLWKQQYVLVKRQIYSQLQNTSLRRRCSPLSCFFLLVTAESPENFPNCISSGTLGKSFDHFCSHSAFISSRIKASSCFSARAQYSETVSVPNSSNVFTSRTLVTRL